MYANAALILRQMYLFDTARFSNKSLTNDYVIVSHGRATFAPTTEFTIYKHLSAYAKRD